MQQAHQSKQSKWAWRVGWASWCTGVEVVRLRQRFSCINETVPFASLLYYHHLGYFFMQYCDAPLVPHLCVRSYQKGSTSCLQSFFMKALGACPCPRTPAYNQSGMCGGHLMSPPQSLILASKSTPAGCSGMGSELAAGDSGRVMAKRYAGNYCPLKIIVAYRATAPAACWS